MATHLPAWRTAGETGRLTSVCVALRLTSKMKCFTFSRALIRPWAGNESLSFVLGGWGGWIQCPPLSNGPGWDKMAFA